MNQEKEKFFALERRIKKAQINKNEYFGDEKLRAIASSNWEDLKEYRDKPLDLWEKVLTVIFERFGYIRVADVKNEFKRLTGGFKPLEKKNDWKNQTIRSFFTNPTLKDTPKSENKIKINDGMKKDFADVMENLSEKEVKWYKDRFSW